MTNDEQMSWEAAVETLRNDPAQSELARACFYDDPLSDAAERYWCSTEWAEVRQRLPQSVGTALDIGSGRGVAAYALARDGWHTTALEPDSSAIVGAGAIKSLAQESNLQIQVVQEWGERLPFDDESFDVVYCRAVLHHARDLNALCREVGRVLKHGGTFLATREHVVSKKEDIPAFQENHPLHHLYGGEYAYLLDEYVSALKGAGLAIINQLNPMSSDINLYPSSRIEVKKRWASRIGFPIARMIPDKLLELRGEQISDPGRLYSFVTRKP